MLRRLLAGIAIHIYKNVNSFKHFTKNALLTYIEQWMDLKFIQFNTGLLWVSHLRNIHIDSDI